MFKALFLASLFVTLMVNIMFLFATKDKPPDLSARDDDDNHTLIHFQAGKNRLKSRTMPSAEENNQQKTVRVFPVHFNHDSSCDNEQQDSAMQMLHIRVKSSKNHVFVSANDLIIYESKSAAKRQQEARHFADANYKLTEPGARDDISHHSKEPFIAGAAASAYESYSPDVVEDNADGSDGRGMHVVVLNEFNGFMMAKRVFDTYSPGQNDELSAFIQTIRDGRILVFAIKDEASFKMANNSSARYLIQKLGSQHITHLGWRDMWAFVAQKSTSINTAETEIVVRGKQINRKQPTTFGESLVKSSKFTSWARPVVLDVKLLLVGDGCKRKNNTSQYNDPTSENCKWGSEVRHEDRRRLAFCSKIEGYARVCDCEQPAEIEFNPAKITNSQLDGVPILVMASNRPYYLYRMLRSLLAADGVNSSMVTVFIDGFDKDPLRVSQLFNLRTVQQAPLSRRSARISHHYKSSLTDTFDRLFPRAEFAIIFEEDLDVSPDIMIYFNQTLDLLKQDSSLYCSSAWNDQGYQHSTGNDAGLLYRIETMPGLGWMLSRQLYKQELEPNWPAADRPHDWDMWIRTESIRKQRECIIPDVSRTFHFGSIGTNINSYFQHQYFSKHAFFNYSQSSRQPTQFRDLDKLTKEAYEEHIERLISEAECVHQADAEGRTSRDFLCSLAGQSENDTNNTTTSSVIFIEMIDDHDYANWLKLANCWRIWDLDARGQHKSMWRLFLFGRPVFVVGVPASPYAKLKPAHVKPFTL